MKRAISRLLPALCGAAAFALLPGAALADPGIAAVTVHGAPGGGQTYDLTLQVLLLMTAVTLLPAILLMMTAFTRIIIVLSILRQALGAGQTPPNQVLLGIALFLTLFVMAPVVDRINEQAVKPYVAGSIDATTALQKASGPLKTFMLNQTRESDIATFVRISGGKDTPLRRTCRSRCSCRPSSRASSRPPSSSAF